jgi:hypothetical protein
LLNFLHRHNSELDPSEAAAQAIRVWLDDIRRKELMDEDQAPDGYFWKNVFLPNGTRIHLSSRVGFGCAFIVDGQFVYRGIPMSPNQFASMAGANTRNAWRDLVVRIPGETRPKLAHVLRREQTGAAPKRRPSRRADTSDTQTAYENPSDAQLLPPPYKPPKSPLAEIPDWVMNNRRKNCQCIGDTMFED